MSGMDMPPEIILLVCRWLEPREILALAHTSQELYGVLAEDIWSRVVIYNGIGRAHHGLDALEQPSLNFCGYSRYYRSEVRPQRNQLVIYPRSLSRFLDTVRSGTLDRHLPLIRTLGMYDGEEPVAAKDRAAHNLKMKKLGEVLRNSGALHSLLVVEVETNFSRNSIVNLAKAVNMPINLRAKLDDTTQLTSNIISRLPIKSLALTIDTRDFDLQELGRYLPPTVEKLIVFSSHFHANRIPPKKFKEFVSRAQNLHTLLMFVIMNNVKDDTNWVPHATRRLAVVDGEWLKRDIERETQKSVLPNVNSLYLVTEYGQFFSEFEFTNLESLTLCRDENSHEIAYGTTELSTAYKTHLINMFENNPNLKTLTLAKYLFRDVAAILALAPGKIKHLTVHGLDRLNQEVMSQYDAYLDFFVEQCSDLYYLYANIRGWRSRLPAIRKLLTSNPRLEPDSVHLYDIHDDGSAPSLNSALVGDKVLRERWLSS